MIRVHIKEMFIVSEEYRAVGIVVSKSFVDMLVLLSFVFYHFDYTNMFHHYAKAVSLDNLRNLFQYLDF